MPWYADEDTAGLIAFPFTSSNLNLAQCSSDINFWHYMSEHEAL